MQLTLTRSLLTILIPGAIAISPWMLYLLMEFDWIRRVYESQPFPFHVVVFALVVILGSLIEGAGTHIENLWDTRAGKSVPNFEEETWIDRDWYDYLAISHGGAEPVAYRYLSRKVTALYFELGLMIATPVGFLGLAYLLIRVDAQWYFTLTTVLCSLLAPAVFWKSAVDTHEVLCKTRRHVLARMPRPKISIGK